MMAVKKEHNEVANVLLEAGADVNLQSNDVSWVGVTTFTHFTPYTVLVVKVVTSPYAHWQFFILTVLYRRIEGQH